MPDVLTDAFAYKEAVMDGNAKSLSNLPIKQRLAIGFAFVILVMLAPNLLSLYGLTRVENLIAEKTTITDQELDTTDGSINVGGMELTSELKRIKSLAIMTTVISLICAVLLSFMMTRLISRTIDHGGS
jgi:hypothetical protein